MGLKVFSADIVSFKGKLAAVFQVWAEACTCMCEGLLAMVFASETACARHKCKEMMTVGDCSTQYRWLGQGEVPSMCSGTTSRLFSSRYTELSLIITLTNKHRTTIAAVSACNSHCPKPHC